MDGWVVFGTKLDTKDFDKQISEVEYELEQVEYELSKKKELKLDSRQISEYESKAERLRNKIIDLKKRQQDLNNTNLRDVERSIDRVGNSVSRVIKRIGKWALAVFSVRSAYSLISRSVSTLSQYNDQIKTDIQYIGFSIATSLQPVIEYLINLVYELLGAINSISIAWFGVNLFAEATAENMRKGVKSAEKMKKSLAGFDEMNVLQDTSTSGAGGTGTPSVDLSQFSGESGKKVKNFWDDIFKFWEEDWQYFFTNVEGNWGSFIEGLGLTGKGFYDTFKGVFDLIEGLIKVLVGVFTGNFDLIKEGWSKMTEGMKNILLGLLEIITGLLLTALGFVKGVFLDLVQGIYNTVIKPIGNFFVNLINGIVNNVIQGVNFIINKFNSIVGFFSGLVSKILGFFSSIGGKAGEIVASSFKRVVNGVLGAIEGILNTPIRSINKLIDVINKVPGINLGKLYTFNLPRLAVGGIVNMPGRGVPIGGAITGERGAEGVIPLTDSQAMEELGATIGRYITINANITNTMNGRVISRELQKINTNNNFATNK